MLEMSVPPVTAVVSPLDRETLHRGLRVWVLGVMSLALLSALRVATNAEYAFASLALLPVVAAAWYTGVLGGQVMALLGVATWLIGDTQGLQFDWPWEAWYANLLPRLISYSAIAALTCKAATQLRCERELARQDGLTGLCNRRAFVQRCDVELVRSQRYGYSVGMAYLDLDRFKSLNDKQGHDAGDRALLAAADALRSTTRASDVVARLGGDEFAVLLVGVDFASAKQTIQRISEAVNVSLRSFPEVSASVGLAWFGSLKLTTSEMMSRADSVMYRSKREGPGRCTVEDCSSTPA